MFNVRGVVNLDFNCMTNEGDKKICDFSQKFTGHLVYLVFTISNFNLKNIPPRGGFVATDTKKIHND